MIEFYDKHSRVRGTDHAIFISILIHYYKWIKVLSVFLLSMVLTIKPTSLIYKNKRRLLWLGCMGYGRKRQTNEKIWISYSSSFPMKIGDLTFLPSSVESSDLFSSSATKPCLINLADGHRYSVVRWKSAPWISKAWQTDCKLKNPLHI